MKLLICLIFTIALVTPLAAQTPSVEAQAKQELNEAARAYREGNYAEAQAHSEKALLLDPQNKTAPSFIARSIHSQYKPGDFTPENVAKAQEAILAYRRVLERQPGDDECFKAIAFLYGAIKDEEQLRLWITQRAEDLSIANDKRAEAFVVLASKDWDCSFKITELNKTSTLTRNKIRVSYRMPKERPEFQRAKECATHGLEMANMAITLAPENEAAWSYKTNILLELSKLAEMSGDVQQKADWLRQYEEALRETTKLPQRSQPAP
jgi:tetratricopeptide (TPR) repeat protein